MRSPNKMPYQGSFWVWTRVTTSDDVTMLRRPHWLSPYQIDPCLCGIEMTPSLVTGRGLERVCFIFAAPEMKMKYRISFLVTTLTVASSAIRATAANCHSYGFSESLPGGRYCATGDTALRNTGFNQCMYVCLQSVNCAAFNHNIIEDECTLLHKPCPLAQQDPEMAYFIFSETPVQKCSQWIPYTSGEAIDDRMIASQINRVMVGRIKYKDNFIIGFEYIPHGKCHTYSTVDDQIVSSGLSAPCERLRIADDCTAFWMPYTAGDRLPARAVTGGHMASGEVAYVVKFDIVYNGEVATISGYYTEGAQYAFSVYHGLVSSSTMMMLLIS